MIHRILWSLLAILSSAWIAGYMAIVLPVIFKRMQPGTQNGNFTMWADAGWAFFAALLCISIGIIILCAKNDKLIRSIICAVLILGIGLFQYLSFHNTYAITEAHIQRDKAEKDTEAYKQQDAVLQVAHKSSERNVGIMLILLCGQIVLSVYAVARNDQQADA